MTQDNDTEQPWALELANLALENKRGILSYSDRVQIYSQLNRQHLRINELESEAAENARIIGASAEKELALRAQVQELQRRVAVLENELSKRTSGSLKPVAWIHEDTFYNMNNTTRSEKTRWIVYNLSEHHSTDGMIPLYVAPVVQEKYEV